MLPRFALTSLLLAGLATPSFAQRPPQPPPPEGGGWLSGYSFQMEMAKLSGDDTRFQWDFDIGGEVDLLRTGPGRVNLLVNYESVLGEQLQRFDPIFNNYTIDVSGGLRRGELEFALRFHHVSQHLGDRPKRYGIAWNMIGPQVNWYRSRRDLHMQVRGWALGTVAWYSVDYDAEIGADALVDRALNTRLSLVGRGNVQWFLVDRQRSTRDAQNGGRLEVALRLIGRGAAAEFYAGIERRIDADPIERLPVTWGLVGLRFLSR